MDHLKRDSSTPTIHFQGRAVSFREGRFASYGTTYTFISPIKSRFLSRLKSQSVTQQNKPSGLHLPPSFPNISGQILIFQKKIAGVPVSLTIHYHFWGVPPKTPVVFRSQKIFDHHHHHHPWTWVSPGTSVSDSTYKI